VFPRVQPRSTRDNESGAFAIGSRVLITASKGGQRDIELSDQDGMPTGVRVRVDELTTITAWRPRRAAAPRYRVRSADGIEGWTEAGNLRRPPAPPPPPVAVQPAPRPVPARPAAKAPAAKAPAAKAPAAKAPAAKSRPQPAAHARKSPPKRTKPRRS